MKTPIRKYASLLFFVITPLYIVAMFAFANEMTSMIAITAVYTVAFMAITWRGVQAHITGANDDEKQIEMLPARIALARSAGKKAQVTGARAEIIAALLAWLDGRLVSPVILDTKLAEAFSPPRTIGRTGDEALHTHLNALLRSANPLIKDKAIAEKVAADIQSLKSARARDLAVALSETIAILLPAARSVEPGDPQAVLAKIETIVEGESSEFGPSYYGVPVIIANAMAIANIPPDMLNIMDWDEARPFFQPLLHAAFGVRYKEKLIPPKSRRPVGNIKDGG
jgi:hypothetical protein